MGFLGLAAIALAIANPLIAATLDLCVENPARLDEFTVQAFRQELGVILAVSGRPAAITRCRPGPATVTITLRDQPPDTETSALGRTRIVSGRLAPQIELFVAPTAQIVGTRLPGVLGRALARVATHELGHLLDQSQGHSTRGVMMEQLSAAHLMAADRSFFRVPPSD